MSVWDKYSSRIEISGTTRRDETKKNAQRRLKNRNKESLSFQNVTIDDIERQATIIDSDNLNEKTILSTVGEDIKCGAMIEWANYHWIVKERDAHDEIYTRAKMLQCNYLLRWIDDNAAIHEQWCVIEDGTKYLTGEMEDRSFVVSRGDSRISMTISRNEDTVKFNRESRFIIDDPDGKGRLAYLLTKPLKVGWVYNNDGVYCFVLQEVATTDNDNIPLGVADYYKYFPDEERVDIDRDHGVSINPDDNTTQEGKKVWL